MPHDIIGGQVRVIENASVSGVAPAGSVWSSVNDMAKWSMLLLNQGKAGDRVLLKPETVALMSRNAMGDISCRPLKSHIPGRSTDMNFVDGMKWGLTFMINPAAFPGARSAGSLSWGGLANSYYWIDPAAGLGGVFMSQLSPFGDPGALAAFGALERMAYRL